MLSVFTRPHRGIRHLRQIIWSSALYRRGRRLVAELTRPFRRFEVSFILRKDLTKELERLETGANIEIGPASTQEVEQAAIAMGHRDQSSGEVFRWRMESGCLCLVARAGSTPVGYDWIRFRPGPDDGDIIGLSQGDLYSFDLYVDENWRGHRVAAALVTQSYIFLKGQGYKTLYAKVSVFNRKSVRNSRRCGGTPSGLVLRVRGSKRGGWPIITLWGSSHPLSRLRSSYPVETVGTCAVSAKDNNPRQEQSLVPFRVRDLKGRTRLSMP
jgi:GNAT superfamily N-acetyltransferase